MTTELLYLTSFTLGIRHGFDFDHVTAIADLVGTKLSTQAEGQNSSVKLTSLKYQSCGLAVAYASGHALVLALLGLGALLFRAVLPEWIDPFMEKVVGVTLVVLGAMMLFSVSASANSAQIKSRGMLLLSSASRFRQWIDTKLLKRGDALHQHEPAELCNWQCAATIGALHGVGAETGTQVLLFASMSGSGDSTIGVMMLSTFILGMLLSSTALAIVLSEGYSRLLLASRWLAIVGLAVAVSSIIIGLLFLAGHPPF